MHSWCVESFFIRATNELTNAPELEGYAVEVKQHLTGFYVPISSANSLMYRKSSC